MMTYIEISMLYYSVMVVAFIMALVVSNVIKAILYPVYCMFIENQYDGYVDDIINILTAIWAFIWYLVFYLGILSKIGKI